MDFSITIKTLKKYVVSVFSDR